MTIKRIFLTTAYIITMATAVMAEGPQHRCLHIQGTDKDSSRKATAAEWIAGTIVDEDEVKTCPMGQWFRAEEISNEVFARMWLKSWKRECTLRRTDLRYLMVLHRNAEGLSQRGEMVVSSSIADKVLSIFRRLYEAGYRIERMVLIDNYDADDELSMRANNSSAFNFRFMTGSKTRVSKHGLGLAIDINPLYNPCRGAVYNSYSGRNAFCRSIATWAGQGRRTVSQLRCETACWFRAGDTRNAGSP